MKEKQVSFTHWRLSWRAFEDGTLESSDFYLPKDEKPKDHIADIINVVELSASEYGYEYELSIIEDKTGKASLISGGVH